VGRGQLKLFEARENHIDGVENEKQQVKTEKGEGEGANSKKVVEGKREIHGKTCVRGRGGRRDSYSMLYTRELCGTCRSNKGGGGGSELKKAL